MPEILPEIVKRRLDKKNKVLQDIIDQKKRDKLQADIDTAVALAVKAATDQLQAELKKIIPTATDIAQQVDLPEIPSIDEIASRVVVEVPTIDDIVAKIVLPTPEPLKPAKDGVGFDVKRSKVNDDGELILFDTDGNKGNVGKVRGESVIMPDTLLRNPRKNVQQITSTDGSIEISTDEGSDLGGVGTVNIRPGKIDIVEITGDITLNRDDHLGKLLYVKSTGHTIKVPLSTDTVNIWGVGDWCDVKNSAINFTTTIIVDDGADEKLNGVVDGTEELIRIRNGGGRILKVEDDDTDFSGSLKG